MRMQPRAPQPARSTAGTLRKRALSWHGLPPILSALLWCSSRHSTVVSVLSHASLLPTEVERMAPEPEHVCMPAAELDPAHGRCEIGLFRPFGLPPPLRAACSHCSWCPARAHG